MKHGGANPIYDSDTTMGYHEDIMKHPQFSFKKSPGFWTRPFPTWKVHALRQYVLLQACLDPTCSYSPSGRGRWSMVAVKYEGCWDGYVQM